MIKTIPTVRASPLLLSIQIIVLRNYCVILFWPSGQCTLFTVFKYDFSTYFNRETKRDLTSRAILSCPLSLRFNSNLYQLAEQYRGKDIGRLPNEGRRC